MNKTVRRINYIQEEGETKQLITDSNGNKYIRQYEPHELLITKPLQGGKEVINMDLGKEQYLKGFMFDSNYKIGSLGIELQIADPKNNKNSIRYEMAEDFIARNELDENGNVIRTSTYRKDSETFMEYDENNRLANFESWAVEGSFFSNFLEGASIETEYDSEKRPVLEIVENYDVDEEEQWKEANDGLFLKNNFYLENH